MFFSIIAKFVEIYLAFNDAIWTRVDTVFLIFIKVFIINVNVKFIVGLFLILFLTIICIICMVGLKFILNIWQKRFLLRAFRVCHILINMNLKLFIQYLVVITKKIKIAITFAETHPVFFIFLKKARKCQFLSYPFKKVFFCKHFFYILQIIHFFGFFKEKSTFLT